MSIMKMNVECPHQVSWVIFHHNCVCGWMVEDHRLGAGNVASIIKDEHEGVIIGIGESFTQDLFRWWLEFPSQVFSLPLGPTNIYKKDKINEFHYIFKVSLAENERSQMLS